MFKVKPEPSNLVSYRVITLLFKLSVALVKQSLIREPGSQPLPEHRLGMNIYKAEGIFFLFLKREFEVILHVFFSRCRWWDVQTPSFPCLLKERSFLGDIFIKISACRKMTHWRISAQEIRDLKGGIGGGGEPRLHLAETSLLSPRELSYFCFPLPAFWGSVCWEDRWELGLWFQLVARKACHWWWLCVLLAGPYKRSMEVFDCMFPSVPPVGNSCGKLYRFFLKCHITTSFIATP